jgi:hypothetical protein
LKGITVAEQNSTSGRETQEYRDWLRLLEREEAQRDESAANRQEVAAPRPSER